MEIGIGLPNPVPGVAGTALVAWARRAEECGFHALATIDRLNYPNHDSLTSLAAAAGATSRIGLITNILLGPAYPPPLLAKNAATLASISGGRFTLGIGVGGRADDYELTGRSFRRRGREFDALLDYLGKTLDEGRIAPRADIPILIGGTSDRAVQRAARHAAGWTLGGGPPEMAAPMVAKVRAAWAEAGRDGEPRIAALTYFSLGDDDASRAYLMDYYAFLGPWAERIAGSALRTPEAIKDAVRAFEDAGVTELYLDPTATSLEQVDRLAEVVH